MRKLVKKVARREPLRKLEVLKEAVEENAVEFMEKRDENFDEISREASSDMIDFSLADENIPSVESTTPSIDKNVLSTESTAAPLTPKRNRVIDYGLASPPSTNKRRKVVDISSEKGSKESAEETIDSIGYPTPTSSSSTSAPSIYSLGKALFQRGSTAKSILGREMERKTLYTFFETKIPDRVNGALYLCGLPGTGKTALLTEVVEEMVEKFKDVRDIRWANINCMIVDSAEDIFDEIYNGLQAPKVLDKTKASTVEKLDQLFISEPSSTCHIVILDELDHIVTRDQEVLFRIFQWAFTKGSSLILVGIANALDLTGRFLPRLRSNNLTPDVVSFNPYTAEEIASIIEQRLRSLDGESASKAIPLMYAQAIQLCALKTAVNTGDLRKAFDICRRALELVEEEVRRKHLKQVEDIDASKYKETIIKNSFGQGTFSSLTVETAPKVNVSHIAKICNSAFGGSTVQRIRSLNVQQKAVLCVLVTAEKHANSNSVNNTTSILNSNNDKLTVSKLFDRYTKMGQEKMLGSLQLNEFLEVISALEFQGVVNVTGVCGRKGLGSANSRRRTSRGGGGAGVGRSSLGVRDDFGQRRISSNVHQIDLMTGINDVNILKRFLGSSSQ